MTTHPMSTNYRLSVKVAEALRTLVWSTFLSTPKATTEMISGTFTDNTTANNAALDRFLADGGY